MKNLLEKFYSMKGDYDVRTSNPFGLITFLNAEKTKGAQYFHNVNFEDWFNYFIEEWNVKDIISVEETEFGTLIVEVE